VQYVNACADGKMHWRLVPEERTHRLVQVGAASQVPNGHILQLQALSLALASALDENDNLHPQKLPHALASSHLSQADQLMRFALFLTRCPALHTWCVNAESLLSTVMDDH